MLKIKDWLKCKDAQFTKETDNIILLHKCNQAVFFDFTYLAFGYNAHGIRFTKAHDDMIHIDWALVNRLSLNIMANGTCEADSIEYVDGRGYVICEEDVES